MTIGEYSNTLNHIKFTQGKIACVAYINRTLTFGLYMSKYVCDETFHNEDFGRSFIDLTKSYK